MKITTKTTKQELKNILGANVKAVKEQDKDLFDRIAYADKIAKTDDSKVTRKDLTDLVKEVIALLGDKIVEPALAQETNTSEAPATETPVEPKAENSVKKLQKSKKTAEKPVEEPTETPVETPTEETAEEPIEAPAEEAPAQNEEKAEKVDKKKSAKKSSLGKKKEQPKKDGVTVLDGTDNQKAVQLAKMFPQTLEVGDAKYNLATDIKDMDDLHKALSNEEEVVFAFYWTKRHLKQFPYFGELLGQPKSFDNDLDLATCIYVSDEKKVAYTLSMYTEAFYTIMPDFMVQEDGVRFASGVEFQIYRAV